MVFFSVKKSLVMVLLLGSFFLCTNAFAVQGDLVRVTVDAGGGDANDSSTNSALSADGHYIAFQSSASNLVVGDTNATRDVFVRDMTTGTITLISINNFGVQGNSTSQFPGISADGRYVSFESDATNLVPGDGNASRDIFVHDRTTGLTTRVSVTSTGAEGDGDSYSPNISADGRYVAFYSLATNLVAGDTNGRRDVFVHDRTTGTTTRASVNSVGAQGDISSLEPDISADGRYLSFGSDSTNLVAGDTNGFKDIFVRDQALATTTRVSVSSAGVQGNGTSYTSEISADGRYVVFSSAASNLVAGDTNWARDIFVHDRTAGTTSRVSVSSAGVEGDGHSSYPSISADGRYVTFYSDSTNLVPGDTNGVKDAFLHDRSTGTTIRISVSSVGVEGDGDSYYGGISSDNRYMTFYSNASNLVSGDGNARIDVFLYDNGAGSSSSFASGGGGGGGGGCFVSTLTE